MTHSKVGNTARSHVVLNPKFTFCFLFFTAHLDHGEAMEADTEVGVAAGAEKATVVAAKWPAVEALEAEEVGVAAMPHTK